MSLVLLFHFQIENLADAGVGPVGGWVCHGSTSSTAWYSWRRESLWILLHPFGSGRNPLPAVVMPRLRRIDVWVTRDNNTAVINYAGSHYLVSKSFDRRCGVIIRPLQRVYG